MRRVLISIVATGLLTLGSAPVVASNLDEQWSQPDETVDGHYSILLQEDLPLSARFSMLTTNLSAGPTVCKSTEGDCAAGNEFLYQASLPICTSASDLDCIVGLTAIGGSGEEEAARFKVYTFDGHPDLYETPGTLGIPRAASPSVWTFARNVHELGNEYLVAVSLTGSARRGSGVTPNSFYAYLSPVSVKTEPSQLGFDTPFGYAAGCWQVTRTTGERGISCSNGSALGFGKYRCAIDTRTDCLLKRAFPSDTSFSLRVRLSSEPTGWLHGRMKDPSVQITKLSGGGVEIAVSALPIRVPTFYDGAVATELPSGIREFYVRCLTNNTCRGASRQYRPFEPEPPETRNYRSLPELFKQQAMDEMSIWLSHAGNRAAATPSYWSIRTLSQEELSGVSGCLVRGTGVNGIVSTNSTVYSEGPPKFINGQLRYKVMSPHLAADGSVFRGTYNLLVRSDVARCIYGFSNAPIQASVEVINEDGTSNVATTVVNEQGGWLSLAAHNFTFSAPTIQVTLKQAALPATPKVVVKQYIACVKGNTVKRIAASRCPSGFKRK